MELEASLRFRLTVWPGMPLRLPPFQRRTSYRLDESKTALVGSAEAAEVTERHGQIYLRLYNLDLTDPEAILAFAGKHGALDGRFVATALSGFSFAGGRYTYTCPPYNISSVIQADTEVRRCLDPQQPDWPASFQPLEIIPLNLFVFAARCLRDLTTAWRLVNQDLTLEPARARWELHPDLEPPTGLEALSLLTTTIQPLLTRFHPFVHALYSFEGDEELDEATDALKPAPTTRGAILEQARGLGNAQLHEICALELYNHIAGQESYRHCHNETCGRLFVTQWGRAEHGQTRRQGVLYCTPSCAQAQAQRVYRRHKKTRREQNP